MLGPLILDLESTHVTPEEKELLQHPLVGGVIFFQRNYIDKHQLIDLIKTIRTIRSELLISVDQEGGRVQRFTQDFTRLNAFSDLGKQYDLDQEKAIQQLREHASTMASELLAVGVDFSFTPVVDLDKGVSDVIGSRSFHRDPQVVSHLAKEYITVMRQHGMSAVAKHFPGHGSVTSDTHHAIAIDERSYEKIFSEDMKPFMTLIHAGVQAIMPAHIIFPEIDKVPVGFSANWLQKILRQQCRFEGVIISDDLSMQGATMMGDMTSRAELSLDAGCDLLLICNNRKDVIHVLDNLRSDDRRQKEKHSRLSALRAGFS